MTTEITIVEKETRPEIVENVIDDKTGEHVEIVEEIVDEKIDELSKTDKIEDEEQWEKHSLQIAAILTPMALKIDQLAEQIQNLHTSAILQAEQIASLKPPILEESRKNEEEDDPLKTEEIKQPEELEKIEKKPRNWI